MRPYLLVFTTVVTIATLYVPQPLLPRIAAELGLAPEHAALLTTAAFAPLAILPLFYGLLMEAVSARRIVLGSLAIIVGSSLAIAAVHDLTTLLVLRVLQGAAVPAILTALMTHISRTTAPERVRATMSFYIASTIVGGFIGRAGSGFVGEFFGWRASFVALASLAVIAWLDQWRARTDVRLSLSRPHLGEVVASFRDPYYRSLYLIIFCVFAAFTALLNFLPFRLVELKPDISESSIGLVYSGYLMGVVFALVSPLIARRVGDELGVITVALACYALSTTLFATDRIEMVYLDMLLFCAAMFTVHSLLSGALNARADRYKGVANGLYVASYYGGGTLGSFLPGLVYRSHGWGAFISVLTAIIGIAFIAAWHMRRRERD